MNVLTIQGYFLNAGSPLMHDVERIFQPWQRCEVGCVREVQDLKSQCFVVVHVIPATYKHTSRKLIRAC